MCLQSDKYLALTEARPRDPGYIHCCGNIEAGDENYHNYMPFKCYFVTATKSTSNEMEIRRLCYYLYYILMSNAMSIYRKLKSNNCAATRLKLKHFMRYIFLLLMVFLFFLCVT